MTWRTHALAGINALWLLEVLPEGMRSTNVGLLAVLAVFGALLPDLDAAESKLKSLGIAGIQPFALPSEVLHRTLGHRGPLHALVGLGLVSLLAFGLALWWGWEPSVALWLGYASHLAVDACTKSGIPLLYPNRRRFYLLPPAWRFVTGSRAEERLLPLLALAAALLLLTHFPVSLPKVFGWVAHE